MHTSCNYWHFVLVSFRSVVWICSCNKTNNTLCQFYHSVVLSISTCLHPPTFIVCLLVYVQVCVHMCVETRGQIKGRIPWMLFTVFTSFIHSFIYLFICLFIWDWMCHWFGTYSVCLSCTMHVEWLKYYVYDLT